MCDDHEHYINYSTDDDNDLCFCHAAIKAISGYPVYTRIDAYGRETECVICDREARAKFLKKNVLIKKDQITDEMQPVEIETVFKDFFDDGLDSTPKDIRKVLERGNLIATSTHVYQYLHKGIL